MMWAKEVLAKHIESIAPYVVAYHDGIPSEILNCDLQLQKMFTGALHSIASAPYMTASWYVRTCR